MNTITQKAIEGFRGGLNCAQAIVTAYADDMKLERDLALGVACGFGGGMGRLQETCGAVTGSYMVLGIHICGRVADNKERKEKTYALVQEFSRQFKKNQGSLDCRELLKCDLNTEEGKQYIRDHNLHEAVCEKCIIDSVKILGDIMQ